MKNATPLAILLATVLLSFGSFPIISLANQDAVVIFDPSRAAAELRAMRLRKKKRKGILRRKETDLTSVLFPGMKPVSYQRDALIFMITEAVQSKRTNVPFEFYDLPGCPAPSFLEKFRRNAAHGHQRKNLGARLQGLGLKPAPYELHVLQRMPCKVLCEERLPVHKVKWLRKLVSEQYRIHLTLDYLPVLMRHSEKDYAVRGFPIGFKAPPSYTGLPQDEYFLYNHLRFTVTYQVDSSSETGYFITGFNVYPVSIKHKGDRSTCPGDISTRDRRRLDEGEDEEDEEVSDEDEDEEPTSRRDSPMNDPATYLPLRMGPEGEDMTVVYSYEVYWEESDLSWADRWDVYLMGSPDDDIHFFAIVNSLMIVLFLTGAIAIIMIRTLRQDISAYNADVDGTEETGWKLLHGDVFRPPRSNPSLLAVLVGTGAQIGASFLITMMASVLKIVNPVRKGHTLTAILVVYVLCGSVSGYISARLYKFFQGKNGSLNTILTATWLPGILVGVFTILNFFLSMAGAATAVSVLTLLAIFALWVCVSAPLVLAGSLIGYRAKPIEVPTKTTQIGRIVPSMGPWYSKPPISFFLGGILPFGSVCIELFFIMSALWLQQIYYVMGFLLAVLIILAATCAEVSIVMGYMQLCAEDHRWWWKSFGNTASAGGYLFLYSLWFLFTRLNLVGMLSKLVYLTYMGMISLCFGLFCGSVGVLSAFQFNRVIYAAVKAD